MKHNQLIDASRCVMNYIVVVLHGWAAFQYVDKGTFEYYLWDFVCNHLCWIAVPCFFMISGYLMFWDFSIYCWPQKMYRRVKRLAVPYIVWNLTFVIFYLAAACYA